MSPTNHTENKYIAYSMYVLCFAIQRHNIRNC